MTSARLKALEMVAMIPSPIAVRHMEPTPPVSDVPPTTTIVMTSKTMSGLMLACAELSWEAVMMPATPIDSPEST